MMYKYVISVIIVLTGCCGYSTRPMLPSQYKSIAIPIVENQTMKPGLGDFLTSQLTDDFTKDRSLKITQIDRADLVLECRIMNYDRSPLSYNANQQVQTYKTTLTASVKVTDKSKQEAEPLYIGEVSTWIISDAQSENEEIGINHAIKKLSQEIIRKVLTTW